MELRPLRRRRAWRRGARLLGALLVLACWSCASTPDRLSRPRYVPPDWNGPLVTWWSDERPREDGSYRAGRRNGHVKGYHPDGSLAFEGDFEDGVPVGQIVFNYPGGARAVEQSVVGGVAQGERVEFYPGGAVRSRVTMVAGRRQGDLIEYHENGQVALRGRCEQDVPVGAWERFDPEGRTSAEIRYFAGPAAAPAPPPATAPKDDAGRPATDGAPPSAEASPSPPAGYLETDYDTRGRIVAQTWSRRVDGDWVTRVTTWFPGGRQSGLVESRNGLREGLEESWDESGVLRLSGRRVADLREGEWRSWDAGGRLASVTVWQHDRAVGSEAAPDGEPHAAPDRPGPSG